MSSNAFVMENDTRKDYNEVREDLIEESCRKFLSEGKIYENITQVAIMISNLCNYGYLHKKCPASCIEKKEIMPTKLVYKILDELADVGFKGIIMFSVYNEPLIDPRICVFMQYVKKVMPNSKILIYSNGYYLDKDMINTLLEMGMDILTVTAYGYEEWKRLTDIKTSIPYRVLYGRLDERLCIYDRCLGNPNREMCRAFLYQIPIYSNGDVGVCCLDHRHPYNIGNIKDKTLKEILNSDRVIEFQKKILAGDRSTFEICQNCGWSR